MRVLRPALLPLILAGLAYLVSPLVAVQMLQRAIAAGDLRRIEASVDWPMLRASIKRSLRERMAEAAAARPAEPSFLQRVGYRFQDTLAPGMIDRMVERKATPEGFVRYFQQSPPSVGGDPSDPGVPPATAGSAGPAAAGMTRRIAQLRFIDPVRFSFEARDRVDPSRLYRVEMHLGSGFWRLARVEVVTLGSLGPR